MDELTRSPSRPPQDPSRGVETERLDGPWGIFRIAMKIRKEDPGYRAIYALEGEEVLFIRIVRRDAATYAGLRRSVRLLTGRLGPRDLDADEEGS